MSPIEDYLARLRAEMKGNPLLARRVLEEVRDHLVLAAEEERRSGMSDQEAEEKAVNRFGAPDQFARKFNRLALPFRLLLIFMTLATVLVALWLVFVIAVVLPSRDPEHIPLWRSVAVAFFAYSALTWAYLIKGPRVVWLRWTVLLVSLAAIALGIYGIVNMIMVAQAGGHFEGYIILMGLILGGHGLTAILYTVLTRRVARRVGTPAS
jgi:cation transport ATPase